MIRPLLCECISLSFLDGCRGHGWQPDRPPRPGVGSACQPARHPARDDKFLDEREQSVDDERERGDEDRSDDREVVIVVGEPLEQEPAEAGRCGSECLMPVRPT